jgi:metallo-beta-lactamase family protein
MPIKLTFLGAARTVTGSRYLLEANGARLLVDCGLCQEREIQSRNWQPFPVPPHTIHAAFFTHAHLDHCGLFPKFYREGFSGRLYCTAATSEIAQVVLEDSARLQEESARFKKDRHLQEGRTVAHPEAPLYGVEDARACQGCFSAAKYGEPVLISDGIEATFHNVGHVLGASFIRIVIRRNGQETAIVFSGDIGRWNMPILQDPSLPAQADYLLVESTYGDRLHPPGQDTAGLLAAEVNRVRDAGGNLVIPTFALERAQDVLFQLNNLLLADKIPHLMTFLDSPMAINISEVFERHPELYAGEMTRLVGERNSPFDLPGLKFTRTTQESKAINHIRGSCIIMSGAGMCTGGRIKHHLTHNITRPESAILFVGYQAEGTLGRQIADGAKEVRILGQTWPVRARVARLDGCSGHADRDELLRWLGGLKTPPKKTFVVHGESQAALSFAALVSQRPGWTAVAPTYGQEFVLE